MNHWFRFLFPKTGRLLSVRPWCSVMLMLVAASACEAASPESESESESDSDSDSALQEEPAGSDLTYHPTALPDADEGSPAWYARNGWSEIRDPAAYVSEERKRGENEELNGRTPELWMVGTSSDGAFWRKKIADSKPGASSSVDSSAEVAKDVMVSRSYDPQRSLLGDPRDETVQGHLDIFSTRPPVTSPGNLPGDITATPRTTALVFGTDNLQPVISKTVLRWYEQRVQGRVYSAWQKDFNTTTEFLGSATMIGPRHALTAAHVVWDYDREAEGYPKDILDHNNSIYGPPRFYPGQFNQYDADGGSYEIIGRWVLRSRSEIT